LVQEARAKANLPKHVTFAACRHGGMTELGDAGLTEPQIMSLSAHETPAAAECTSSELKSSAWQRHVKGANLSITAHDRRERGRANRKRPRVGMKEVNRVGMNSEQGV